MPKMSKSHLGPLSVNSITNGANNQSCSRFYTAEYRCQVWKGFEKYLKSNPVETCFRPGEWRDRRTLFLSVAPSPREREQQIPSGVNTMRPLYIINAEISPEFADMYRIPDKIWIQWALWRPRGTSCGKWPTHCASRSRGISIGFGILKISNLQNMSQTNLVPLGLYSWAQGAPGTHILRTSKSSSSELEKSVVWIQWKLFAQ